MIDLLVFPRDLASASYSNVVRTQKEPVYMPNCIWLEVMINDENAVAIMIIMTT